MVFLLVWGFCAIATASIASSRGKNTIIWLLIGCLLGIFGVIVALMLPKAELAPGLSKKCPDCAETVLFEAKVCKHCGHQFPARERPAVDMSKWTAEDRERFERQYPL